MDYSASQLGLVKQPLLASLPTCPLRLVIPKLSRTPRRAKQTGFRNPLCSSWIYHCLLDLTSGIAVPVSAATGPHNRSTGRTSKRELKLNSRTRSRFRGRGFCHGFHICVPLTIVETGQCSSSTVACVTDSHAFDTEHRWRLQGVPSSGRAATR